MLLQGQMGTRSSMSAARIKTQDCRNHAMEDEHDTAEQICVRSVESELCSDRRHGNHCSQSLNPWPCSLQDQIQNINIQYKY